jgi:hypothetical protein
MEPTPVLTVEAMERVAKEVFGPALVDHIADAATILVQSEMVRLLPDMVKAEVDRLIASGLHPKLSVVWE